VDAFDYFCGVLTKPFKLSEHILIDGGGKFPVITQVQLLRDAIYYASWVSTIGSSDALSRRASALLVPVGRYMFARGAARYFRLSVSGISRLKSRLKSR
jgi:hypothetical protein